jgi:hypothetical protein
MDIQAPVHERLNSLIEHFAKGNKTAFAKEVGTLPSVIASIVGGRMSKPSFELLEKITVRYPEINAGWLLTGRGSMVMPEAPDRVEIPYRAPRPMAERKPGQFLPPDYVGYDPYEEFRAQRTKDFEYTLQVISYLVEMNPSQKLLKLQERIPFTLNPNYDPDNEPDQYDGEGNRIG